MTKLFQSFLFDNIDDFISSKITPSIIHFNVIRAWNSHYSPETVILKYTQL